jgi:Spy/CpxP family protein refolding chaperone
MKLLITALTLVSLSSFASEVDLGEKIMQPAKCEGLELTQEQKVVIKKLVKSTRRQVQKLRPAVKQARMNLKKVLLDASTTKEEAKAAHKEVRLAAKPIRKLRRKTRAQIDFDILDGDQRVKLVKCRMERRQGRRRGRRGGRLSLRQKLEAAMPGIMPILPN